MNGHEIFSVQIVPCLVVGLHVYSAPCLCCTGGATVNRVKVALHLQLRNHLQRQNLIYVEVYVLQRYVLQHRCDDKLEKDA